MGISKLTNSHFKNNSIYLSNPIAISSVFYQQTPLPALPRSKLFSKQIFDKALSSLSLYTLGIKVIIHDRLHRF
jgi:hypothetical protein